MDIQELAEKLQQEGIAKGKQEAEKLIAQAQKSAEEIIQRAQEQEKQILQQAEQKAQSILESAKQNIRFAARDIMLQLQYRLQQTFQNLIKLGGKKALAMPELWKSVIISLLESYHKSCGQHLIRLEIPANLSQNLKQWLLEEWKAEFQDKKELYGFRLQDKDGGQIEVTPEAVEEALSPFVSQFVRELLKEK